MNLPRTSRRSFLRTTLAAGVAPMFLPGRIWSADVKPNDKLSIGLIGNGKMNTGHLNDWLKRADTQVVAVCDVDTTRRENAKKTTETFYSKATDSNYKGCAAFTNFEDLLARKDIDLVCIATPDHWHAIIDIAAAKAGKDIYAEKPMTDTIHEAWAVVKAVRDNSRVFQTGSQQRSSREFRVACELARNGVIGKVYHVAVGIGGPGKACDLPEEAMEPGLDWDRWLGPAPKRPYNSELSPRGVHNHFPNWRKYWEYGGGMVTDWGAHHFDICQWGLGEDGRGPIEINPAPTADAQEGAKLKYNDGVEVTHVSANGVTFHGEKGMIFVNRGRFILKIGDKEVANFSTKESKPPLSAQLDLVENTWLGITGGLRFAAITNYREPGANRPNAPSRGAILMDYLAGDMAAGEYLQDLAVKASIYNGFNLIVGDPRHLYYFSNKLSAPRQLHPGFYGLSNHLLDTPWPKVVRGKKLLRPHMVETDNVDSLLLLDLLADSQRPPDHQLPETGVGLAWERLLGSIFIDGVNYGTRSSAVITVTDAGAIEFTEKTLQRTADKERGSELVCLTLNG